MTHRRAASVLAGSFGNMKGAEAAASIETPPPLFGARRLEIEADPLLYFLKCNRI